MEQYYLGSLNHHLTAGSRAIKLLEIEYTRRPPSFGALYLAPSTKKRHTEASSNLCLYLDKLELEADNRAKFVNSSQIELIWDACDSTRRPIDFDAVRKSITLDAGSDEEELPQCVVLCADGSLVAVHLIDGTIKRLAGTREQSQAFKGTFGNFLQCKLHQSFCQSDEPKFCQIFVLAERNYFAYRLRAKTGDLDLIYSYSLNTNDSIGAALRFNTLLEINEQTVVAELIDFSLKVIHKSKCLSTIKSSERPKQPTKYLLLCASNNGATFVAASQTQLTAFNLQVNLNSVRDASEDPDQLLPKEPSFEFEQCWSIDLTHLDCIRSLDATSEDEDSKQNSCLASLWASNQLRDSDSGAKYLLVAYKYHILVYSFEQKQSLPFSLVYDSSFLELAPFNQDDESVGKQNSASNTYIDVRSEPTLVQNFKLIGAQPSDALFNTLFLAKKMQFNQIQYFPQLTLLVAISNLPTISVLKITSPKIAIQKDNLYQQLVAESIRGNSLLRDEIKRLESANESLRDDVSRLEINSAIGVDQMSTNFDRILQVELKRRQDIGALYNLTISVPGLVEIDEIIVASRVRSHFLEPSGARVGQAFDEAPEDGRDHRAFVVANEILDDHESVKSLLQRNTDDCDEPIFSYISLRPELNVGQPQDTLIVLPVFIADGQLGHMDVYFVVKFSNTSTTNPSHHALYPVEDLDKDADHNGLDTGLKFHKRSVLVKPLLSYETTISPKLTRQSSSVMKLTGDFSQRQAYEWLFQCLYLDTNSDVTFNLTSVFTQCSIECSVPMDGELTITSDDFLALELIKRFILRRATDQSIKLDIDCPKPTPTNVRQFLAKQLRSITSTMKLSDQITATITPDNDDLDNLTNLLIENLLSEANFAELPSDFLPKDDIEFETSLRASIKSVRQSVAWNQRNEVNDRESRARTKDTDRIYWDLVAGHMACYLVDYGKSETTKLSASVMQTLKETIIAIISTQSVFNQATDFNLLVDKILTESTRIKNSTN